MEDTTGGGTWARDCAVGDEGWSRRLDPGREPGIAS